MDLPSEGIFFFPFFFARIFFLGIFPCMHFFFAFSPSPPPPHHFSNGPSLNTRKMTLKMTSSHSAGGWGCRNVSQCHLKQSFPGLHSPGSSRSYKVTSATCISTARNPAVKSIQNSLFRVVWSALYSKVFHLLISRCHQELKDRTKWYPHPGQRRTRYWHLRSRSPLFGLVTSDRAVCPGGPKKIPGPKINLKKSHAEFPSLKNFPESIKWYNTKNKNIRNWMSVFVYSS